MTCSCLLGYYNNMFDVKESDFFDLEDEAFDTIMEPGIKFTGT